jgi:hypothetical protein
MWDREGKPRKMLCCACWELTHKDVEERALEAVVDHLLLQVLPDASVGLQRKTGRALRAGVNEGCPSSSDGGAPAKGIHPEES